MTDRRRATPTARIAHDGQTPPFVPFLTGPDLPGDLIARLCRVLCPPLLAVVDMPTFVRLIGASHSLSALEKLRVFEGLPTLSQYQIDELMNVMEDEVDEFYNLVSKEWQTIAGLSARSWLHLCLVADYLGAGYPDEEAERKALSRMLKRKYGVEGRKDWLDRARGCSPLGNHVFSAFTNPAPRLRAQGERAALPKAF
jgi:hypothetical protein